MDSEKKRSLREQAEKRLEEKADLSAPVDRRRLIEELQVHQIELEIQNEELRRSQSELQMLQMKYFDLFENAPVGYATLDSRGRFVEVNLTLAEMLGVERRYLKDQVFSRFVAPHDQPRFMQQLDQIKRLALKHSTQLRLVRARGPHFDVLAEGIALEDRLDNMLIRLTITDISDRLRDVEALKTSEARFHFLYENTPTINLILNPEGTIEDVNMAGLHRLGYARRDVINKPATAFVAHKHRRMVAETIQYVAAGKSVDEQETIVRAKDGTPHVIVFSSGHELLLVKGKPSNVMFIGMDLTEHRRVEKELRWHQRMSLKQSRQRAEKLELAVQKRTQDLHEANQWLASEGAARLRSEKETERQKEVLENIFNHVPVILCFHDTAGKLQRVNRAFENILGWTFEETKQIDIMEKFFPDPVSRQEAKNFLARSADGEWRDFTVLSRGGTEREISWASVFMSDGTRIAIGVDISDRNQAVRALMNSENSLRVLSIRLLHVQEEERRSVAMDLHDSIAATLSAIKMRLETITARLETEDPAESKARLFKVVKMTKDLNGSVRRLMTDLRPPVLDDLGLVPALRSHGGQFQEFNPKISFVFKSDGVDEQTIPEHMKIVIFRIAQEALNNVGKHSQADHVWVTVTQQNHGLELEVGDNGKGFDAAAFDELSQEQKGFGLSSMRERVRLSGGVFSLESVPGKGTTVRAAWSFGK